MDSKAYDRSVVVRGMTALHDLYDRLPDVQDVERRYDEVMALLSEIARAPTEKIVADMSELAMGRDVPRERWKKFYYNLLSRELARRPR